MPPYQISSCTTRLSSFPVPRLFCVILQGLYYRPNWSSVPGVAGGRQRLRSPVEYQVPRSIRLACGPSRAPRSAMCPGAIGQSNSSVGRPRCCQSPMPSISSAASAGWARANGAAASILTWPCAKNLENRRSCRWRWHGRGLRTWARHRWRLGPLRGVLEKDAARPRASLFLMRIVENPLGSHAAARPDIQEAAAGLLNCFPHRPLYDRTALIEGPFGPSRAPCLKPS